MPRVWKFGDDVDTDQIVPGRYSPYMTSEAELPKYAFIENRPEFAKEVKPGDIIVAENNFGCGSSREYAPLALKKCGIAAIIANSFARIFFRNAINCGLLVLECDTSKIQDKEELEIDPLAGKVFNLSQGTVIETRPLPQVMIDILNEGGLVNYFKKYGTFRGV
ncbi:MAG: 3-isopropylmalate dehydratase small subunit [Candidatus Caldatribacteriaceae bacterium]